MKTMRFTGITLAVMMLLVTACGPQAAPVSTAGDQVAATAAAPEAPEAEPVSAATQAPDSDSAATVSFSKDILPMMGDSCVSCHGGEKTSRGLDMKSYASLMAGSQNGAVIVAGDAANSKLIAAVQSGKMPKRGTKLTAEQIKLLVDWVNAGALNN